MLETVEATAEVFTNHTADKNNPHNVTKEQVGLGNVDNTADIDKPVSNAVNSAINTFKEENSKEHTKIHSAINTFKEESEITFTEINNVIEALQTNIQQAEQLIGSLRDETNTALANKADSNHNHDSTYSKTNHTHTGYAASSHNHDNVYLKSATAASQYAAKSHTHSNYSPTNHTHTGYAASSHNHDTVYSKTNHTHAGYMPKVSKNNGIGYLEQIAGQGVQVTYRLPSDGTYFYFLTCTNDYNDYSAVDNQSGIAEGGTEILPASMNKKTFGGFIWRIQ